MLWLGGFALLAIFCVMIVARCTGPGLPFAVPTVTSNPPTPVSGPTGADQPCAYMWASQELPELTTQLQAFFDTRVDFELQVSATAFGENCVNEDGSLREFLRMSTDVQFSISVETIDKAVEAERAAQILDGIETYQTANPEVKLDGTLSLQFIDAQKQLSAYSVPLPAALAAAQAGLRGDELMKVLAGDSSQE